MEKMSPQMQAKTAHNNLLFTMVICDAIKTGKIPYQLFNEIVPLSSQGEIFAHVRPKWGKTNLKSDADNLILGSIGVCFTGINTALDEAFGSLQGKINNPLRSIIYEVRCAFALHPLLPAWKVTTGYSKTYCIDKLNLTFDFAALNGQFLDTAQFGGWKGIFDLADYCVAFLESTPNPSLESA